MKRVICILSVLTLFFCGANAQNRNNRNNRNSQEKSRSEQINRGLERAVEKATGEKIQITGGDEADEKDRQLDEVNQMLMEGKITASQAFEMQRAIIEDGSFGKLTVKILTRTEVQALDPAGRKEYGRVILGEMDRMEKEKNGLQQQKGNELNKECKDLLDFDVNKAWQAKMGHSFFNPNRLLNQPADAMADDINNLMEKTKRVIMTQEGMNSTKALIGKKKQEVLAIEEEYNQKKAKADDALSILAEICPECAK